MFNPLDHPLCLEAADRLCVTAWAEHFPFAVYAVEALRPRTVVELGSHFGFSFCAFCQAVRALDLDARCYAVDTWEGDDHAGRYGPEVLTDLREHHDPRYGRFSTLLRSTFDEARGQFADGAVDLLHIDGFHTFEAVAHDFEGWLPKMSPRGVVLLHDTNVRDRGFGVWRFWEEVRGRFPAFEFDHGHGLGVLAVGGAIPEGLRHLFEADAEATARLRLAFSRLGAIHEVRLRAIEAIEAQEQADLRSDRLRAESDQIGIDRDAARRDFDAANADRVAIADDREAIRRDRDALIVDREALVVDRDALIVDREALIVDREANAAELQTLISDRAALIADRDANAAVRIELASRVDALVADRDAIADDRESLRRDRDALIGHRNALIAEREALFADRDAIAGDREAVRRDREALRRDRDALRQRAIALALESDALRVDRDAHAAESIALRVDRDAHAADRVALLGDRDRLAAMAAADSGSLEVLRPQLDDARLTIAWLHGEIAARDARLGDLWARADSQDRTIADLSAEVAALRASPAHRLFDAAGRLSRSLGLRRRDRPAKAPPAHHLDAHPVTARPKPSDSAADSASS